MASTIKSLAVSMGLLLLAGCDGEPEVRVESDEALLATCAPFEAELVGTEYECRGLGNGWLTVTVHPVGQQTPECVNWGEQGKPDKPTIADCVALDLRTLPHGIPGPGACCGPAVAPEQIVEHCAIDCGYAACKLAVAGIRQAANALPKRGARGVVRSDLFALANKLEDPTQLAACASDVAQGEGETVPVPLGPGPSGKNKLGHVQSATLHLSCALDPGEPFAASQQSCEAPPNLPGAQSPGE